MAVYYGHKPDGIGFFSHYKHKVNANLLAKAAYLLPWSSWVRDSLIQDYQIPPERIMVVPQELIWINGAPGPILVTGR